MFKRNTAWQKSGPGYNKLVGQEGHYYHQAIILPKVKALLNLQTGQSLLDVGCGTGLLASKIPDGVKYLGIDASQYLIDQAKRANPRRDFLVADATRGINGKFTQAIFMLSLQNMRDGEQAIKNVGQALNSSGKLLLVLNHPAFRIPRQTSWEIDAGNKQQYRRVNRYLSPLEIPITMHPGQGNTSDVTWTYHHAIGDYAKWLKEAGFTIELIEEWASDKESVGRTARMENLARAEFPLFLAILARRV